LILDTEFDGQTNLAKARLHTIQAYFPSRELKMWKRWESPDEKGMVGAFVEWFLGVSDKILIGYNLLKIDIPLLLIKSIDSAQSDAFFKKINRCNIVDLHTILTFLNEGKIVGFNEWCERFKIPYNPPIGAEQVDEYVRLGKYDVVTRYVEEEAKAIGTLHKALYNRGKLDAALRTLMNP